MCKIDSEKIYRGIVNVSPELVEDAENPAAKKSKNVMRIKPHLKRIAGIAAALIVILSVTAAAIGPAIRQGMARFFDSEAETSKTASAAPVDPSLLRSFEEGGGAGGGSASKSIDKRLYLEINETTRLPETLPIYEDEFPTYKSVPQYPSEKLSKKEAEARMKEYLEFFCENTGQPVPELNIFLEDFGKTADQYWCDDVNEQIEQMQYKDSGLDVVGSSDNNPDFYDEEVMLEDPFIKSAISCQSIIRKPEFKRVKSSDERCYQVRVAEQTDELKWNMLYEYFNSVVIRRRGAFKVSINRPLPESPLAEARVIPYEKAKESVEKEYSCPVLYCEAAYDRDIIYPGRYIPVYRFYLQGEDGNFTRLVPMTDYPIPKGEEMQQYMNEAFGEYAAAYDYVEEDNTSADPSLLMSFEDFSDADRDDLESFEKRPYLEINETTPLPETLPIYEDEFPTYQSQPQYPFEKLSREEAEASMREYLEILCKNTGQPMPELNIYVRNLEPLTGRYCFDDVNEQITQMQYLDSGLGVVGFPDEPPDEPPDFYEAAKNMDEEAMLAAPLIKSAISYQNIIQKPEFKKIWEGKYFESHGDRHIRIAEQTDELKWNMLYEYFNSVEISSGPVSFRISIRMPLPESPLAEARVIPYETAKEFVEKKYSCSVLYCEAVYNRNIIYPGRYIPIYRFKLRGNGYLFTRLVPMTDYPIPQGEEMQQYMNEAFGEYATEYHHGMEGNTGTYTPIGEKGNAGLLSKEPSQSTVSFPRMIFENFSDGDRHTLESFEKRPYLEISETTPLPETLPIYEDKFPTYQSSLQYPIDKLTKKEAKARIKEYVEILCKNTGQPMPELNIFAKTYRQAADEYWCDSVTGQFNRIKYNGLSMDVLGGSMLGGSMLIGSESQPNFYETAENMDEEAMLAVPVIKSAVSCQNLQNPEFKKIRGIEDDESCGFKQLRIAEQTDELKWNMLYEYFNSVEIRSGPVSFRISIRMPLPESPLEEARVIPYEKAKESIEKEYSCPVVYCEAAYDRTNIYPGRYIPVYRFYLQGEDCIFIRLVPMTDYSIPKGEEMQQYMNEAFGEYATGYHYVKNDGAEAHTDTESKKTAGSTSADPSLLMSFSESGDAGGYALAGFAIRPYLEVNEGTQLPETLPIYEDEFPTYKSLPQYPSEKLSKEEAEARMKEYLEIFCENTAQPTPELNTYVKEFRQTADEYWCDDVNERIIQMQYEDSGLGVLGSSEDNPDFYGVTESMDEEAMLTNPFIKSAVSYENLQNPEFSKIWQSEYDESQGWRHIRIAEQTDELKWDMLYEYFNSVEIHSGPSGFKVSIHPDLPETPLAEARVVPYETAMLFVENEYWCSVVCCEAVYDKDVVYPGRYIPVYRFYLQGEDGIFIRLVPMTDYPIPKGEEMQQYMNEAFGEYATEYYYEKEENAGTYTDIGGKGKIY